MYNKLRLGIYVSSRLHLSATPSLLRFFTSLFPSFSSSAATNTRTRKRRRKEETSRDLVEETL